MNKQKNSYFFHISTFAKHKIRNATDCKMFFIESQTGKHFGKDDIVRLEDSYERV